MKLKTKENNLKNVSPDVSNVTTSFNCVSSKKSSSKSSQKNQIISTANNTFEGMNNNSFSIKKSVIILLYSGALIVRTHDIPLNSVILTTHKSIYMLAVCSEFQKYFIDINNFIIFF